MASDTEKRKIMFTEKGQQYKLELKQNETQQLLKTLTTFSKHFESFLTETSEYEVAQPAYTEWLSRYDQLLTTYEQCLQLMTDEGEINTYKEWFNSRVQGFERLNSYAHDWFTKHPKVQVEDSKSRVSHVSRVSSRHSNISSQLSAAKLKEDQRKAELLARTKTLQEKRALEEEKLKLRFKEEELDLKTELQVSDAKAKVIEDLERSILQDQEMKDELIQEMSKPQTSTLNPSVPEWVPRQSTSSEIFKPSIKFQADMPHNDNSYNIFEDTKVKQVSENKVKPPEQQCDLSALAIARELNKPKSDIKVFDGNPMNFKAFQRQFEARIVSNTDSYDERLNYLLQFTSGEAHRIASGYSHLNAKIGYDATWAEFLDRYGDSDVIAHAYVKKAINWPTVKPDNPKSLDDFAIFLRECLYAVENVDAAKILEYSENLKHLVQKLPFYMHDKWRNIVFETKAKNQVVKFSQLVEFVKREAKKLNDPVYGKDILSKSSYPRSDSSFKPTPVTKSVRKNFSVSANESSIVGGKTNTLSNTNKGSAAKVPCLFCKGSSHTLEHCKEIMKKDLKDRYEFLRSNNLCFGCLKANHRKIDCRNKAQCNDCKRSHPSILHVDPKGETEKPTSPISATSSATYAHTGAGDLSFLSQALPIVPVKLKHSDSNNFIETYAFLDTGSTSTFCSEDILKRLNVTGRKTKINLLTMGQESLVDSEVVSSLEICDLNGDNTVSLPPIYSQPSLPVSKKDIVTKKDLQRWQHLQDIPLEHIDAEVGLLIGINVPRAMEPWEVVGSIDNSPFAVKTLLGWVINGPLDVSSQENTTSTCNSISAIEMSLEDQLRKHFDFDFSERTIDDVLCPSKEDCKFMESVSQSATLQDGHYYIDLPFKERPNEMPNNRTHANQRLISLAKRFVRDQEFKAEYVTFMSKMLEKGYASEVAPNELRNNNGDKWYLPHHGVYHPRKHKLRIVFDCASKYQGSSLNDRLLQGPNLTNSLVGTLIRFRENDIAIMGDIDSMFHQVRVPKEDASFLRFLWWKDGDTKQQPVEYQMNVHLFGATSSPSCVNYALRCTAENGRNLFDDEVIETVLRNFYMDDCLKSVASVDKAIKLVSDIQRLLNQGGFHIAKWISNSRDVIKSVPIEARSKSVMDLDLDQDNLPSDRALGVQWLVDSDEFGFHIDRTDKPITRRGILSLISSVYDPLGFLAPFTFTGKRILQDLCKLKIDWDDPIPELESEKWNEWLQDLEKLTSFRVKRCLKPSHYGNLVSSELHHFADASEIGYGTVSYIRMEDESGEIHCSFLLGKSRVTPLKQVTIPRLELTAATVAVRTNRMILNELEIPVQHSYFWTDSMSVLRYIRNTTSRYHTFVANRLAIIHEGSNSGNWNYINTKLNPADIASRGISADDLVSGNKWIAPPEFLFKDRSYWPISQDVDLEPDENDKEVKKIVSRATVVTESNNVNDSDCVDKLLDSSSSWYVLK